LIVIQIADLPEFLDGRYCYFNPEFAASDEDKKPVKANEYGMLYKATLPNFAISLSL